MITTTNIVIISSGIMIMIMIMIMIITPTTTITLILLILIIPYCSALRSFSGSVPRRCPLRSAW
jgi:hypothetical protein